MLKIFPALFFAVILLIKSVSSQSCGVPKVGRGNVIGGSHVTHGEFPWHSAIMKLDDAGDSNYLCGGTLISNKHIITAAHCMLEKGNYRSLLPRDTLVVLGGHNLNLRFESGRQILTPIKIHVHPDWNPRTVSFDADLAVLELEFSITFTDYIQPICLWTYSSSPSATSGLVVGYGKSEDATKKHENIPKMITVPFPTQESCFLSHPGLSRISSERTFCGGQKDGTGVCLGDSGSGLIVKSNDAYYLKGITSSSLRSDNTCDVNNYSVFTNILKFKDWIANFVAIKVTTKTYNDECGIMSSSSGLIQRGKFSSRDQFPWMASIVDSVEASGVNTSGALISHKHVVTRGRVIGYLNGAEYTTINLNRIKIYLGSLEHVSNPNAYDAQGLYLHPNVGITEGIGTNDIGIILLATSVQFNDFIRPVCLWTFGSEENLIRNLPTYAVGYGRDTNGKLNNIKKHAKMNLVDQSECQERYKKHPAFFKASKAFCMLGVDNGNPCEWDECLFVKFNGKWYLRGLMVGAYFYSDRSCKFDHPYLYEDISIHTQWIQSRI